MKLREREYHQCRSCKQRTTVKQEEQYGCDTCSKVIDLGSSSASGKSHGYLKADVFFNDHRPTDSLTFCSWACALKGLKKAKSDYFITLPYLTFDGGEADKGISAADFWKAVRAFK